MNSIINPNEYRVTSQKLGIISLQLIAAIKFN